MTYKKLDGITGGRGGCFHCGYQYEILPTEFFDNEEHRIAVGFGCANVTKNGVHVIGEGVNQEYEDCPSYKEAEELAAAEPDEDWRIHLVAPLSERHYQRQGPKHWVLYEKGQGFA